MPVLMFKCSTAKSAHRGEPGRIEASLREAVESAGGRLVCLHVGGGGSVAYGLVEGPHDYDGVLAILSVVAAIVEDIVSVITD